TRTGGQILVDQLRVHGVDTAFCVPGESYLAVLDALHDSEIRLVVCRHEAGAANMAEAYGKLTGRPGICLVTRGPGATHASVGVHTAFQDSTPLLLLVGQVARGMLGREAFQEIDFRAMFAPVAKWADQVESADRVPELVGRAFATATAGRPGPVVLALPEDMLSEKTDAGDAAPHAVVRAHPGADALEQLRDLLAGAERPFVLVGGGGWSAGAAEDMVAFCEGSELPIGTSFRCQDYVDNHSRVYAGHVGIGPDPKLAARVRGADVLLVVGARLGEATTGGYTLVEPPRPRQTLVHVHADPEELGRVYGPALAINAGSPQFAAAARALEPLDPDAWRMETQRARADYRANLRHAPLPGELDLGEVLAHLRDRLPDDAILTNGAGNFSIWPHRFYEYRHYRTQLAPTSGAMGYGVPAAVAAKLVHPERTVVCFAGDGDFLMTGQELATAVQYSLPFVVLLVNNGMYGTIRMHQERQYPGRVVGTELVNPDFAAYAEAFGAHGEVVERTDDFAPAFERALKAGRPALLELRVDPEAITPRQTLTEIREAAQR
ncbi:MAG: thiamine pyrophosphate-binding protein, partial [Actinobacteria bacterium]|nr:thiamine pyrophosphate-binding protein [Actinomycetota bacterium]